MISRVSRGGWSRCAGSSGSLPASNFTATSARCEPPASSRCAGRFTRARSAAARTTNPSSQSCSRRCLRRETQSIAGSPLGRRDRSTRMTLAPSLHQDATIRANRFIRLRNVVSSSSGDGGGPARLFSGERHQAEPGQTDRPVRNLGCAVEPLEHAQGPDHPPVVAEPEPEPLAVGTRLRSSPGAAARNARGEGQRPADPRAR